MQKHWCPPHPHPVSQALFLELSLLCKENQGSLASSWGEVLLPPGSWESRQSFPLRRC